MDGLRGKCAASEGRGRPEIQGGTSAYQSQPPAADDGRVRIVNAFTVPETVIVNNKAYTVYPAQL